LENNLRGPGKTIQCGEAVDLSLINVPTFLYASREDHIVPWRTEQLASGAGGRRSAGTQEHRTHALPPVSSRRLPPTQLPIGSRIQCANLTPSDRDGAALPNDLIPVIVLHRIQNH